MASIKTREYRMDNYKFFLIVLVIFAHLQELILFGPNADKQFVPLYKCIYLFHMPAFIFITGYFSKKVNQASLIQSVLTYIVFQKLYYDFTVKIMHYPIPTSIYTYPVWIMWFLFALIIWKLITPLIGKFKLSLPLAIIIATTAGVFITDNNYLAVSRTLVYFPFFLIGYYWKQSYTDFLIRGGKKEPLSQPPLWPKLLALACLLTALTCFLFFIRHIHLHFLYHKVSYSFINYPPLLGTLKKVYVLFLGLIITISLLVLIPNKKLPLISRAGGGTLSAYLLHGFIIKYIKLKNILLLTPLLQNQAFLLFCSIILALILSSAPINNLLNYPFKLATQNILKIYRICQTKLNQIRNKA